MPLIGAGSSALRMWSRRVMSGSQSQDATAKPELPVVMAPATPYPSALEEMSLETMLKRRQELIGRLAELRERAEQCLSKVKHVEATSVLLDPAFDLDSQEMGIAIPYASVFRPGDITPVVLQTLRRVNCPVCTVEIADRILEERGNPHLDRRGRKRLLNAVFGVLKLCLQRGEVERRGRLRRHAKSNAGSMRWVWTGESPDSA